MRALLRGERTASPLVMGALAALFLMAVTMLILAAGYRNQFFNLKNVIYHRCSQRTGYDTANHESVGADVQLYRSLLDQAEKNAAAVPARYREAERMQQDAIRKALATKEHAYAVGVIGSCNVYK